MRVRLCLHRDHFTSFKYDPLEHNEPASEPHVYCRKKLRKKYLTNFKSRQREGLHLAQKYTEY